MIVSCGPGAIARLRSSRRQIETGPSDLACTAGIGIDYGERSDCRRALGTTERGVGVDLDAFGDPMSGRHVTGLNVDAHDRRARAIDRLHVGARAERT
jgi:hypothetical protein